jgi:type II secretory pathway predicted ATPase ExeA
MDYEKMYELFRWRENPFTFKILPDLLVGHETKAAEITAAVAAGDKFSLLLGPTGSGKTTLLKYICNTLDSEQHVIYLSKPPKNSEDWVVVFKNIVRRGFFSSLFSRHDGVDLYNLSDTMNSKLNEHRCYLLVDECHEASIDSLEWLRTITDHTDNLHVVLAGLPVFETILKENLETFTKRINKRIELASLTKSETIEMIKKRIEHSGGSDIKPFTMHTIDYIYEKTGGFPREILRLCNELSLRALEKSISIIDTNFAREMPASSESRISIERVNELPERQQLIIQALADKGPQTPSEIIANIDVEEYKDKENAVRSVNNLLKRLMNEGLVERKRIGKTYKYTVAKKFQSLLVNA